MYTGEMMITMSDSDSSDSDPLPGDSISFLGTDLR